MKGIKNRLNYAVLDKQTDKIELFNFKTDVAKRIGVSIMTLNRNINYENECFRVYIIANVMLFSTVSHKHNTLKWLYKSEKDNKKYFNQ